MLFSMNIKHLKEVPIPKYEFQEKYHLPMYYHWSLTETGSVLSYREVAKKCPNKKVTYEFYDIDIIPECNLD